jgi:hypothetical protein
MNTENVLLIVGLVLLLFFIIHNVSYHTINTPVTTKSATVIYKTPHVNSLYISPGHYNAYKAQFY